MLLARDDLPLVHLELCFLRDPATESPRTRAAMQLLRATHGDPLNLRDGAAVLRQLDLLGASLHTWLDDLSFSFQLDSPSWSFAEAFALFTGLLKQSEAFPSALRRLRRRALEQGRLSLDTPGRLLLLAERRAVFPAGHPLGRIPAASDFRSCSPSDLQALLADLLQGSSAWIALTGDFHSSSALALLESRLGDLSGGGAVPVIPPPGSGGQVVLVDHRGSRRSRILLSLLVEGDDQLQRAELISRILAADFSSRLNRLLREDAGLVYEMDTHLETFSGFSRIRYSTSVETSQTGEAVGIILRELGGMSDLGAWELERARATMLRDAVAPADGLSPLAATFTWLAARGISVGEYNQALLEPLPLEDLARTASRVCKPGNATWIIVGDREELEPQLEAAGLFPTSLWSARRAVTGE